MWAGLPDPDTRDQLADQADDDTATLRAIMEGWSELPGPMTIANAMDLLDSAPNQYQLLRDQIQRIEHPWSYHFVQYQRRTRQAITAESQASARRLVFRSNGRETAKMDSVLDQPTRESSMNIEAARELLQPSPVQVGVMPEWFASRLKRAFGTLDPDKALGGFPIDSQPGGNTYSITRASRSSRTGLLIRRVSSANHTDLTVRLAY